MANGRRDRFLKMAVESIRRSIEAKDALCRDGTPTILAMAELLVEAFRSRHRLFLFGNGGSAADAQHLAAEFVNRFRMERPALPAVALTVDTSALTSIANDFHFEDVFVRQLEALGQAGDVAMGISTSGKSINVVKALRWARQHGLLTLGLAGAAESEMDIYCDINLKVSADSTARIQECHITAGHVLCEIVEEMLFGKAEE